ncbi:MAG: hypothetical protein C0463_01135 [Idiomarina sp.]|nr:hypothetical protein [Idiomarina sp.]
MLSLGGNLWREKKYHALVVSRPRMLDQQRTGNTTSVYFSWFVNNLLHKAKALHSQGFWLVACIILFT